jgi:PAS domain S-box-containing protein
VTKVNILLVDDRPENLMALEAMLEELDENLVKAHSGEEALKYLLKQEFAAILLDVQMPGMDGFEVASLIKQREKTQYIPIIFITAISRSDAHVFKGYSAGAVDYIFKPIVPEVLRAKVTAFVDLFKKTQQIKQQASIIESANRELEQQLEEVRRLNRELEVVNQEMQLEIAERKRVEEALQRSERLYRTLAQHLPQAAVFLFDHELRCMIAEGGLLEVSGYSSQIEGKSIAEVLPPELAEFWLPQCTAALAGTGSAVEQRFSDSTYFVQTVPVKNEHNEIFAAMGVLQDITELKRAQEAIQRAHDELEIRVRERTADLRAANDELTSFTHILSHDLRSPLVNLKGFAGELEAAAQTLSANLNGALSTLGEAESAKVAQVLQKDVPEALKFIDTAVSRMDYLTSAVLKLARLGRRELDIEPIDMNELVQSIVDSLSHQIRQQNATVKVGNLPPVVADRVALEQILGNLLANAVLYLHPDRPGEIEVTGECKNRDMVFHVRDNGRGIAADDRHKIFEPFRRAGPSDVPGEGMGLAYVQTLLRKHGGRIWFESKLGEGTTFSFSIPKEFE